MQLQWKSYSVNRGGARRGNGGPAVEVYVPCNARRNCYGIAEDDIMTVAL